MFPIVTVIVGVVLAAILGLAASKPATFEVSRSQRIQAPPAKIFELIQDFHKWAVWSPYENLDPAMKRTFSGEESGKGAVYAWAGNSKAGEGRMEIVETSAAAKVIIKLDFIKPFEGHNVAEFTLEPRGEITDVTWSMHGPQAYVAKLMSVFISMDKLVGQAFETGLSNMKAAAESNTKSTYGGGE